MSFISTSSIEAAYNQLINVEVKNESILHIFFILKAIGFNDISFHPIQLIAEKGIDPCYELSGLFNPFEKKPQKYEFINPFSMSKWGAQAPSEPLKKWVTARIKNNVIGGATTWKKIIVDDIYKEQLKFSFNYLLELKELTLGAQKINLPSIAIWSNRFKEFNQKISISELINTFLKNYNINEHEKDLLFESSINLELNFSNKIHDSKKIRQLIGKPSGLSTWLESKEIDLSNQNDEYLKIKPFTMTSTYKTPSIVEVSKLIKTHGQVILSGPPGTSKSFIAEELKKNFDSFSKIQFHPQYSYQDFIGGFYVDGDKVKPRKGFLIDVVEGLSAGKNHLLIIDEINRANVSQVFGETIQCLDRNYTTNYNAGFGNKTFSLPKNLFIVATMNTTDRTLGILDYAFRRRFINIYCPPNPDILLELCECEEKFSVADFLTRINNNLISVMQNRELLIGQAVFLVEQLKEKNIYKLSFKDVEDIFNYKILPIIEEYCFGDLNKLKEIVGQELYNRLTGEIFIKGLKDFCSK